MIDSLPFNSEGYLRAKNILTTKYGKESKIINAPVNKIMSLPVIQGANPNKILKFYETVLPNLQALETMGKIREVNGYVRMTLDKLEGIRGDLVRTNDNWQDWDFPHLLEALRKWTIRNPPKHREERQSQDRLLPHKPMKPFLPKNRSYQTRQEEPKRKPCVYCESVKHQSVNCDKVITVQERRRELNRIQLRFDCTARITRSQSVAVPRVASFATEDITLQFALRRHPNNRRSHQQFDGRIPASNRSD